MEDDLFSADRSTDYIVHGFLEPIRIGEVSAEVDEFLLKRGFTEWAFLTAFNPMSVELGHIENEQRNHHLAQCIEGYDVLTGEGKDRDGIWPPEASFFIAGIMDIPGVCRHPCTRATGRKASCPQPKAKTPRYPRPPFLLEFLLLIF